jgi:hypothetical protein
MILNSPTVSHAMPLKEAVVMSEYSSVIAKITGLDMCVDHNKVVGLGFHFVCGQG